MFILTFFRPLIGHLSLFSQLKLQNRDRIILKQSLIGCHVFLSLSIVENFVNKFWSIDIIFGPSQVTVMLNYWFFFGKLMQTSSWNLIMTTLFKIAGDNDHNRIICHILSHFTHFDIEAFLWKQMPYLIFWRSRKLHEVKMKINNTKWRHRSETMMYGVTLNVSQKSIFYFMLQTLLLQILW